MKFKKLVAALSAVTMLGSLAVAVPASAEEETVEKSVEVTLAGKLRNSASDFSGETNNQNSVKVNSNDTIKLEYANGVYVGAYYYFDADSINIPADSKDVKATLTIAQATGSFFSSINLTVWALDTTKLNKEWNRDNTVEAVKDAIGANANGDATSSSIIESTDTKPRYSTIQDVPFNKEGSNAYFVFGIDSAVNNRRLTGNATLTVSYKHDKPVAKIGEKEYSTFGAAFEAANSNDTITLLEDINVEKDRYVFDNGTTSTDAKTGAVTYKHNIDNVTIDGSGHSMTGGTNSLVFEINGKHITFNNITLKGGTQETINLKGKANITLNNVTLQDKNAINTNDNATITAINLNIDGAKDGVSLFTSAGALGTINITLTPELAAKYDVVDGVLKEKVTTQELNYAFTKTISELGDTVKVTVNTSNGTASNTVKKPTTDGGGSLMLGIILNVPSDVTVNSVTIE